MGDLVGRPLPLRDVASHVGKWVGFLGALVTAAAGYGILSVALSDAVTGLLGLIPGLVTAVTSLIAAAQTARQGEALVTPLSSPVSGLGEPLFPRTSSR